MESTDMAHTHDIETRLKHVQHNFVIIILIIIVVIVVITITGFKCQYLQVK